MVVLKKFLSVFSKETEKKTLSLFKVTVAKEEKKASAITRILHTRTTTEKTELAG